MEGGEESRPRRDDGRTAASKKNSAGAGGRLPFNNPALLGLSVLHVVMAAVVFPIDRVINIRRAQGALPRYRYTSVLNCLYKMPREQGGFRHVWRGVGPHLDLKVVDTP